MLPPSLLILGIGALTLGVWPRRTSAIAYGYLAWSFLIEFIGAIARASHWLPDDVLPHGPRPAKGPDWASAATMTGLEVTAAAVGGVFLNRRDLLGA